MHYMKVYGLTRVYIFIFFVSLLFLADVGSQSFSIGIHQVTSDENTINNSLSGIGFGKNSQTSEKIIKRDDTSTNYEIFNSISISNNSDFNSQALLNGWSGNGSSFNPYIVQNLEIQTNSVSAIVIKNTNVYFILRNILLKVTAGTNPDNSGPGLDIDNVSNGVIDGVTANNNNNFTYRSGASGIAIFRSKNITLMNNIANNNRWSGINIRLSDNNTLINNTALLTVFGGDITLDQSYSNVLISNTVFSYFFIKYSNNNLFENNKGTINLLNSHNNTLRDNSKFSINLENSDGNVIAFNTVYSIVLENSVNNILQGNFMAGSGSYGIYLWSYSDLNLIMGNFIEYFRIGIYMWDANNNTVLNNEINNNVDGIELENSSFNYFSNNSFIKNRDSGITLSGSSNSNTIENNLVEESDRGFYLGSSNFNTFINNSVNNTKSAFGIWSSNFNVIINNSGYNNRHGTYLDSVLVASLPSYSSDNIMKNNFLNQDFNDDVIIRCPADKNSYGSVSLVFAVPEDVPDNRLKGIKYPRKGITTIYIDGVANTSMMKSGLDLDSLNEGIHNITITTMDENRNYYYKSVVFTINKSLNTSCDFSTFDTTEVPTAGNPDPQTSSGYMFHLLIIGLISITIIKKRKIKIK